MHDPFLSSFARARATAALTSLAHIKAGKLAHPANAPLLLDAGADPARFTTVYNQEVLQLQVAELAALVQRLAAPAAEPQA